METATLRSFLSSANGAGYAGGDARSWRREADGSTTIELTLDAWRLHDNFFGGEPYGGREVVFHDGRPVWLMAYYGSVTPGEEPGGVYARLRHALLRAPNEFPVRGPAEDRDGPLTYSNNWTGDVARFAGRETITRDGIEIYAATYCGGWIDQRDGD